MEGFVSFSIKKESSTKFELSKESEGPCREGNESKEKVTLVDQI